MMQLVREAKQLHSRSVAQEISECFAGLARRSPSTQRITHLALEQSSPRSFQPSVHAWNALDQMREECAQYRSDIK